MGQFDLFGYGFACFASGLLVVVAAEYGYLSPLIYLAAGLGVLACLAFWRDFTTRGFK